jgi:tetratricopeptide (TPR) repeat protein
MYRDSWFRLQETSPELLSYEDRALYLIWDISYEQVERQNVNSAMLLRLWAYFDNDDLWFEMVQQGYWTGPPWFQELTHDMLSFNSAVRVLCDYGLVEPDKSSLDHGTESRGYGMHGCVYMWTLHVLNREQDVEMAQLAMRCVGAHVPIPTEKDYSVVQRRLLRHAGSCLAMQSTKGISVTEGDEWILDNLGTLYSDQGRLAEAEAIYERALQGYEKALGPDHTSTLGTVVNLGTLYLRQSRLTEAEAMHERALQGYEKALGPDHMSTLNAVHNLRNLYSHQGRLAEAEAIYERALQGYEKALGRERVDHYIPALNAMQKLVGLYIKPKKLVESRVLYERCKIGVRLVFGPEHDRYRYITQQIASLAQD